MRAHWRLGTAGATVAMLVPVLVVLIVASVADARLIERHLCRNYKCVTVAADAKVRVFERRPTPRAAEQGPVTLARWLPAARITALGEFYELGGGELGPLAVSGEWVAYALNGEERYMNGHSVQVIRLNARTGNKLTAACTAEAMTAGCAEFVPRGGAGVTDVVVTSAGTAAWIVRGAVNGPYALMELAPKTSRPMLLASSATISPHSLAATVGHVLAGRRHPAYSCSAIAAPRERRQGAFDRGASAHRLGRWCALLRPMTNPGRARASPSTPSGSRPGGRLTCRPGSGGGTVRWGARPSSTGWSALPT